MRGRRVRVLFVALLLGATGAVTTIGPAGASQLRFTTQRAPVTPDGTSVNAVTDFVVTWSPSNPAIPGVGLHSGGSIAVTLPDEFVDTGDGSANQAIILQGWQASPRVLSFPPPVFPWDTTVTGNTITATMKPGQSFLPDDTGPGPKSFHLLLNSFRNPYKPGVYWVDVAIDPDPAVEGDEHRGRARVHILPDARPSVNLVSVLSGNPPPPPFDNVQYQSIYVGDAPDPVGFYLWDRDSVPFVGVDLQRVSANAYRLMQGTREVGHVSVHAPRGATDFSLTSTGPSVEQPAFATGIAAGALVMKLEPDPSSVGEYHVRVRIHGGNSEAFFIEVKALPFEIVAAGLNNPRGLVVDEYGVVHVAEAGSGGEHLVEIALGDNDGPNCVGLTGAVAHIDRGRVSRTEGFPSVSAAVDGHCDGPGFGFGSTGPHAVAMHGGEPIVNIGLGGAADSRNALVAAVPQASHFGTIQNGLSADLLAFEDANDPDQSGVDTNGYDIEVTPWGEVLATDAGGNVLHSVTADGTLRLEAVFAPRCVPFMLGPNPIPDEANPCGDPGLFPAQAVPTGVAVHPDGDYLVSTLGGFPFPVGYSRVWKVSADHGPGPAICSTFALVPGSSCEVFADGLTALVGIDVDDRGNAYVVQFADAGVLTASSGVDRGSVVVLDSQGALVSRIGALTLPGGVDTRGGYAYITNLSVVPGGGQLVVARTH